jgi:hypothetical protein
VSDEERRERIATAVLAGILANTPQGNPDLDAAVRRAVIVADKLMARLDGATPP